MTSRKQEKKSGANAAKSRTAVAKSARKAPVGKKHVVAQQPEPKPVVKQRSVKRAVLSGILNEATARTPPPAPVAQEVSGEELYTRIQFRAYILAEQDGFKADPVHYWAQAERAVKAEIRQPAGT